MYFSAIITGFIGLALEGITSFLHHKRHKAVKIMPISMDAQRNKLMHLENTLVMYGIYNAETLENLVKNTTHFAQQAKIIQKLIYRKTSAAYEAYL